MCNIAGYVGTKDAAPILIEMLKRQEGLAGGFYTGIATICDGKLYYAKLTGDTERLVSFTNASKLPGNIGIIHSRSNSGGGDEWSHPFVGMKNNEPSLAYVANGIAGGFDKSNHNEIIAMLIGKGYDMNAHLTNVQKGKYMDLPDGTSVHMSDVMCQLIKYYEDELGDTSRAMTEAFGTIPAEIVGLCISLADSQNIYWSRINRPMMAGFASHGAYLATSALAFPDDASEPFALPANSSGCIGKDQLKITPYSKAPGVVVPMDMALRAKAFDIVKKKLSDGGSYTFKQLKNEIMHLFSGDGSYQDALLIYEILYALYKSDLLSIKKRNVPGAIDTLEAPSFLMSLKN
ncbi:MAG: hypothetical protein II998_11455 [Clostridia bacterium]|nr:hypothetical protein [Clostridia bacterium]